MLAKQLWARIVGQCLQPRRKRGDRIWWARIVAGPFSVPGLPDVFICYEGLFVALELKRDEYDEPTKKQKWTISLISRAGGIVGVVKEIEDAEAILEHAFEISKLLHQALE